MKIGTTIRSMNDNPNRMPSNSIAEFWMDELPLSEGGAESNGFL